MLTQSEGRWSRWRVLVGALLTLGGGVLLLKAAGLLAIGDWVWAAAALLAGLFFVAFYWRDRAQWWVFIPAGALLSLAFTIGTNVLLPETNWLHQISGPLFLGGIGLGFAAAYLANRRMWWTIIPMGALLTLAVMAALGERTQIGGMSTASVLFFGLAATFVLVVLVPGEDRRHRLWALIPAAVLTLTGFLTAASFVTVLNMLGPLTLVLLGLALLWNERRHRHGH